MTVKPLAPSQVNGNASEYYYLVWCWLSVWDNILQFLIRKIFKNFLGIDVEFYHMSFCHFTKWQIRFSSVEVWLYWISFLILNYSYISGSTSTLLCCIYIILLDLLYRYLQFYSPNRIILQHGLKMEYIIWTNRKYCIYFHFLKTFHIFLYS